MSTDALKKQAREHEQNEAWEKALSVYRRALEQSESGGEPEIGLYNRVADLELRLGNVETAIEQYERAIELYLESDLPNNAIAICRKILRNVPGRPETFLRMGQIRARQGFAVEARQNILTYAEMMESGGQTEAATAALETFIAHFPGDVETRIFLGERLVALEQPGPGVGHLLEAWRELGARGAPEEAEEREALQARIVALDPEADFTLGERMAPGVRRDDGRLPGLESSAGFVLDTPAPEEDPAPLEVTFSEIGGADIEVPTEEGEDPGIHGADDAHEVDFSVDDLPAGVDASAPSSVGGDLSGFLGIADGGVERFLHGRETLPTEEDPDDAAPADPSGAMPTGAAGAPETSGIPLESADPLETGSEDFAFGEIDALPDLGSGDGLELPSHGEDADENEDEGEPAPLPGFDAPFGDIPLDAPRPEEWSVEAEPPVGDAAEALPGFSADALEEVEDLEGALVAEPHRLDLWRALVDRAHDEADRPLLIRALAGLAATLEAQGEGERAQSTWDQVRQLDPRHPGLPKPGAELGASPVDLALGEKTPAIQPLEPLELPGGSHESEGEVGAAAGEGRENETRGEDEARQAEPGDIHTEEFVNLGALVLDDEEAPTTRWVVQDEQSGDEDADFAQMLSKFKAKVAQHITRDDARSSYDLGTAYREMGLLDEAIGMFQQALRAQPGHLASLEMLGQCFLDREEPQVAVRVLQRALETASPVEDDLLGIYYFLGVSHERSGNRDEAREFYEKVFSLDINFKDVTERLRALR